MRNLHRIALAGLTAVTFLTLAGMLSAQDDRDRDRDRDAPRAERDAEPTPRDAPPAERRDRDADERDRREGRVRTPDDENAEGTEEGMPEARVAPRVQPGGPGVMPYIRPQPGWRLGVFAVNRDNGVLITRVLPGTPAFRAGLERRDLIVTVNGYQIGYVTGRLYPLGDELQRRADRSGRVTLLVQDHRTGDLVNMDVRLERYGGIPWPRP
jgi:hypothetical protein